MFRVVFEKKGKGKKKQVYDVDFWRLETNADRRRKKMKKRSKRMEFKAQERRNKFQKETNKRALKAWEDHYKGL